MRATTAQRMLIGLGVFLATGTGLLFLTGSREASQVAREMFALAVIVGGTFWLGYRFRVLPRRDSFRGQSESLTFTPQVGDPLGLLDLPFTLFHWAGSVRQIENTATGSHGGQEIVIADYWFAPTAAQQYDDYERYTCVIGPSMAGWSDLTVVPERLVSRLRDAIGVPQINTELEEFNRAFQIRAGDERFASAFVDARMMEWLLEQGPGVGFEVSGTRVMVFRRRATASLDDVADSLALYDDFVEHIPRVVETGSL
jgi:hypothetical protein